MSSTHTDADESPAVQNLRIVLLGASGVGKSSTGNAILGREAFKETPTRESEAQRGRVEERSFSVIDTPGFFNTELTDGDLQNEMMKSLSLSHPGPHVFLLIVRPDTLREDDVENSVQKCQENFGEEVLKFTLVLFIGREKLAKKEWELFLESAKTKKLLSYFEDRFHPMNSKSECDSRQIMKLFRDIDKLVKNNGHHYTIEIYMKNKLREKRKKQEETNTKIQEEKDKLEQITAKHEEEKTKEKQSKERQKDDEEKQHDVSQKGEEYKPKRDTKDKLTDERKTVQESLKSPMKEKEKQIEKRKKQINMSSCGDVRIVLLGKTGSGKSATGNTILCRNAFREDLSLESVTQVCSKEIKTNRRLVSVIDTPGLDETRVKNEIGKCMKMSAPSPHVFLLVLRLGVRLTEEEKNTVKWIQERFGEEASRFTFILFTHVDQLKCSLKDYIEDSKELQQLIIQCYGRYHTVNNKDRGNQAQVTELLDKIDKMVFKNGGQYYTDKRDEQAQERWSCTSM